MAERTYHIRNVQDAYDTADRLPDATRHDVYAHHEGKDEWENLGYRDSLWLDGYGAVGDVSSSEDFYKVIQYGDVVDAVARAVDQYDGALDLAGTVTVSPSGHKMTGMFNLYGDTTIEPVEGDAIDLGLQVRTGHSGFHALKYDVGAERQVCSNGMVAFVSDMHFEQTHGDPFHPGLAQQAVDAVVEGTDEVEDRLSRAREDTFQHEDEALLVLTDVGIDQYFDEPYAVLRDALREETGDRERPTLYDTYNAATRALTHATGDDMPAYVRDEGLARAGTLLDYPGYGLPDADYLGKRAVDNRIDERVDQDEDPDPILENEQERLVELRSHYDE